MPSEARHYKESLCVDAKRIRPSAQALQELALIARDSLDRR
jgi:hypothetical protein